MDISVVIPVYNEEGSLEELTAWIRRVMSDNRTIAYEIIMIDDGSSDRSWEMIEKLAAVAADIKALSFRKNYGKSAALHSGFQLATGDVVITMDADLQDSPEEIPELYRMIKEEQYDLISGWKKKRYDPVSKRLPSKLYNRTVRWISGIILHDFNCGLKAYRNSVVKAIEVYGEMHRYIPYLVWQAGFRRIGEKVVQHQKRKYGSSKYGYKRFIIGFLDLISIIFISRFGKKPMHLFGTLGTLMFLVGFVAAAYLGIQKLYYLNKHIQAILLADSPYFYLALAAMIIGTQLFVAGFLGELISRSSSERNQYQVRKELNL
jgi:glycosyltransferase involved in cell wall biosynthesis